MTISLFIFFAFSFSMLVSQQEKQRTNSFRNINYDLSTPDRIYILPKSLHEISGITEIDMTSIACIQDEHGILFIYDLLKNEIKKQSYFGSNGDYEGIARVDNSIYVLRSDGVLFGIINYESSGFKRVFYNTGIPSGDNEGLCYDQKNNRLLIAPKISIGKDKNIRVIYSFDLHSKKVIKEPAYELDMSAIKQFAQDNKIDVPTEGHKKGGKGKPDIKFRPSAIAVHPLTNRLYVLSAIDRMLFVFDIKGNIEFLSTLDPDTFKQPEGITFLKNGDMLISNEGQNKKPTIVRFNYKGTRLKQ